MAQSLKDVEDAPGSRSSLKLVLLQKNSTEQSNTSNPRGRGEDAPQAVRRSHRVATYIQNTVFLRMSFHERLVGPKIQRFSSDRAPNQCESHVSLCQRPNKKRHSCSGASARLSSSYPAV